MSVTEFLKDPVNFSRDMGEGVDKVLSRNVEESDKKVVNPDLESDDFQNLISSSGGGCLPARKVW